MRWYASRLRITAWSISDLPCAHQQRDKQHLEIADGAVCACPSNRPTNHKPRHCFQLGCVPRFRAASAFCSSPLLAAAAALPGGCRRCGPTHSLISHAAQRQWHGLAGCRHMTPQLAPPRSASSCPCSAATRCCAAASASAPCHIPSTGQNEYGDGVIGAGSATCTASGGQPGCTDGPWPLVMATDVSIVRSRQLSIQGATNGPAPCRPMPRDGCAAETPPSVWTPVAAAARSTAGRSAAQGGVTDRAQVHSFGT